MATLWWEAILYAGPGACLTAGSGAFALGLINFPPRGRIVVATPRNRRSVPGISLLVRRRYDRVIVPSGVPVAPLPDLLIDLAAQEAFNVVRHALAELDYREDLDLSRLLEACGRGRRGSARLRRAIHHHLPQLARCRSRLEIAFVLLLEARLLPLPLVNVMVQGIEADMYWPALRLIVEIDGTGNHHSAAQRRRDQARDAMLAGHGLTVLRLTAPDVYAHQAVTLGTLAAHGVLRSSVMV